jgi:hypothetical protein
MPEFIPDKEIDYKILRALTDSTIDYKIRKFNPENFKIPGRSDKFSPDSLIIKYYPERKKKK